MKRNRKKMSTFWTVLSVFVLCSGATLTLVLKRNATSPTGLAIGDGGEGPGIFRIFIDVDGIDGECLDANHKDWIEALKVSFSALPLSPRSGSELGDSLVFVKQIDTATPKLMDAAVTGSIISTVDIELCYTGTGFSQYGRFFAISMRNVVVERVDFDADVLRVLPEEVVLLTFEEVEITYSEYDHAGQFQGNVSANWRFE